MRIRWRGLELPSRISVDRETLTESYGRFTVEPFERGFGTTVGNSLRRVLLSSLEGSAVSRIRIEGVAHEFTSIPGVVEDVTDIVLNIKSLVVRNRTDVTKTIRIVKEESGPVTAADIVHDESVEIINPEHPICTLSDDRKFQMEMTVTNGRGYQPGVFNENEDHEAGTIPVDAIYSPVLRVAYRTEEARIGQFSNYDRLILEIWTNGTVDPGMALVESAKILRKHLNPFVNYSEQGSDLPVYNAAEELSSGEEQGDPELDSKLAMSLAELDLSVRATNCLETCGISTVRDLVTKDEDALLQVRNFGETTLKEVREKLRKHNLYLGMKLPAPK
jgi:DNA-directed RNA polymerase subunit alpha